jgi:ubiquinone/menaquinone biosynthesis C-methylase UbiE
MTTSSNEQHETESSYFSSAVVSKYLNTIFKSPLHNEWISSLIYDSLELQPGHVLVDMGCGPGVNSTIILNKMKNKIRVIGKCCNMLERVISE